jgi:hypothetical protein
MPLPIDRIMTPDKFPLQEIPPWESLPAPAQQVYYSYCWAMSLKPQCRQPNFFESYLRLIFFPWSCFWPKGGHRNA